MSTQPEALRLADRLMHGNPTWTRREAAAELRRLHELNQEWERKAATWLASPEAAQRLDGYRELAQRSNQLEVLNQELLGALRHLVDMTGEPPDTNCSCHISPPCSDCVENTGWRDAFTFAQSTIAKADTAQKDFPEAVADATI